MRIGRYKKPLYYIARQWRYLAFILALTLLYSATAAMQPWPMKILIDHALRHDTLPAALPSVLDRLALPATPSSLVLMACIFSLLVFGVNCLISVVLSWAWAVAGQRMVYDLS